MTKKKVCWISAGVSSFMAGYLAGNVDAWIYIDIKDQHPDSMRFIKDCERRQSDRRYRFYGRRNIAVLRIV